MKEFISYGKIIYKKNQNFMSWIFLAVIIMYPFLHVNVGIDVTDTGYSLGSFLFEPQMGEEWVLFATYLANLTGSLFAMLPFGNTMLGMNIYTSAIVSLSGAMAYIFLKKKIPTWIIFLGIFMAESLCWCPTIILYNYLTYFLFTYFECGFYPCETTTHNNDVHAYVSPLWFYHSRQPRRVKRKGVLLYYQKDESII